VQCPKCSGDTNVSETRPAGKHTLRRRRVCTQCNWRFTTLEQIALPQLRVEKRGDRPGEAYDRAKLRAALERVTRHRPIELDGVLNRIEATLSELRHVRWSRLVELAIDALRAVDPVSAERLAANYADETGVLRFDDPAPTAPRPQLGLFPEEE
jgi:transcriptional repressor NrdR